jgi:hypothetical protein
MSLFLINGDKEIETIVFQNVFYNINVCNELLNILILQDTVTVFNATFNNILVIL